MRVAVAGLGWWGKQIIACLEKSRRFDVLYGVDPSPPEDIAAFRQPYDFALEADLDKVLRDPAVEGVVLATPHALHEEQALRVIAAGKELFCEKPLTMTAAGARRVVEACRKAGKVLGIGHERRFDPAFEELQRLVDSGDLGKLLLFEANISHDQFRHLGASNWRLDPTHAPAGMMTAVGIHVTDLFAHLAGPVAEVRARKGALVFDPPAEDFVSASILFKSGIRANLTSLSATPFYARVTVFGDSGWVEILNEANIDRGKPTYLVHSDAPERRRQVTYEATDTVTLNFEAWVDAVEGRDVYRFTPEELVDNIRIFEAIVKSASNDGAPERL
ncbi:MAG: Gfo/Idh/MocA family oxidoreductase [Hyphomicrobiales bacterium]|nr:Gfo/Idh/MocA family oxidoreductase [Hyphomicrobiales bacterium]